MTALLEPTERYPRQLRVSYEDGKPVRAVIEGIEFAPSAPQEPDDDAEWLRLLSKASEHICPRFTEADRARLERIATRLQAKAPETD